MTASLRRVCSSLLATVAILIAPAGADIYRWDTGEVISGTEGITPGAQVWFAGGRLEFADLSQAHLAGAAFGHATLTSADLSQADLTSASFYRATLASADLSEAVVTGASFEETTSSGFTAEQLYSTANYQSRDLSGISSCRTGDSRHYHLLAVGWRICRWASSLKAISTTSCSIGAALRGR